IGIAIFATAFSHDAVRARGSLLHDLVPTRPEVMMRLHQMTAGLAARGFAATGGNAALAMFHFITLRQAAVLAFERAFALQGLCFLCSLPLLWFLKVKRGGQRPDHLAIEM
ncbi:MAG: DHA2 family efflux MFS transporter permease subunit, partial [Deltaproteobacteria bacterium]